MQVERHGKAEERFSIATRSFALECLHSLWQHMESSREHSRQQTLQACVAPVVQSAFAVVEERAESLRTGALALLAQVLETFAGVADPADEGGTGEILDVFAAPYTTALKVCLARKEASPSVAQAAMLAGQTLVSGMLTQDRHSCEVSGVSSPSCRARLASLSKGCADLMLVLRGRHKHFTAANVQVQPLCRAYQVQVILAFCLSQFIQKTTSRCAISAAAIDRTAHADWVVINCLIAMLWALSLSTRKAIDWNLKSADSAP